MVILIRKRQIHILVLFVLLYCGMAAILWSGRKENLAVSAGALIPEECIFVIDAGHGGEDGGAVAGDGTMESGINLDIALRLHDLLRFFGQRTALIRNEDISVSTPGLKTFRERKTSDLKNRVAFTNSIHGAVLVSIHQNSLPSVPSVHGAQVFYNAKPGAEALAEQVQGALNLSINHGNEKQKRSIPDSIYLMKHTQVPGVLVECGFLSNAEETRLLKDPKHQLRISAAILSGLLTETDGT